MRLTVPPRTVAIFGALTAAAALAAACGHSRTASDETATLKMAPHELEPSSSSESELLTKMDELPERGTAQLGNADIELTPPYHAASGLPCRGVTIRENGVARSILACRRSEGWFFAPSVFGSLQGGKGSD